MAINNTILNAFQSISLLLVFITIFFNIKYDVIKNDINANVPNGSTAREKLINRINKNFKKNCIPLLLFSGVSFYILFPLTVRIIKNSKFAIWNFNILRTSFIFISIWVGVLFVWSILLSYRIKQKIGEIKNSSDTF